jgi:hypothetical protein
LSKPLLADIDDVSTGVRMADEPSDERGIRPDHEMVRTGVKNLIAAAGVVGATASLHAAAAVSMGQCRDSQRQHAPANAKI